jgi:hypothetical protein
MPLNLNSFIQEMNQLGGPAKVSHFAVQINTPSSISSGSSKTLSLLCESTTLPGISIGTDDNFRPQGFGLPQKMPWEIVFTDLQLTFFGDNKGKVHQILTSWLNSVVSYNASDPLNVSFVAYRSDYATDMKITSFDPLNNTIIEYTLYDCFPTGLFDINVAWGAQNDIMKIPVRFSFNRWTVTYNQLGLAFGGIVGDLVQTVGDLLTGRNPASQISDLFGNVSGALNAPQPFLSFTDNYKNALPLLGGNDSFDI